MKHVLVAYTYVAVCICDVYEYKLTILTEFLSIPAVDHMAIELCGYT